MYYCAVFFFKLLCLRCVIFFKLLLLFQVENDDGNFVTVHSFEESFPHHVRFCMMAAAGVVSGHTAMAPSFRHYVRGYQPRASFPHHTTQVRSRIHERCKGAGEAGGLPPGQARRALAQRNRLSIPASP